MVTGPLESVDWGSLVGRNVVIAGKLEVVDTFNLVRYGEVRVARERLYVPTSRIDPNDRNPEGVSFTGGSNVAKVVAAQKFNDNAVLTIDDGLRGQNIFPPKLFPQLGSSHPTVRIGSTIDGVAGRIARQNNNYVLVCQADDSLVGLVSRHFLRKSSNVKYVAEAMVRQPFFVSSSTLLSPTITQMIRLGIDCLAVVDDGKVVGMLTTRDVQLMLQVSIQSLSTLWQLEQSSPVAGAWGDPAIPQA